MKESRWRMLTIYNGRLVSSLLRNQNAISTTGHLWKACNPPVPFGCLFSTSLANLDQHSVLKAPTISSPILRQAHPVLLQRHILPHRILNELNRRGLSSLVADHTESSDFHSTKSRSQIKTIDATASSEEQTSPPTRPIVAYHLFFCAALVYLIIVVGGLTRLTESGLSITEWNPGFKGMKLPWTDSEWNAEWDKYRGTPEWAVLNQHMTVDDFKKIYMWEWSHRILGRVIGMAVLLPSAFFLARGYVAKGSRWKLIAIFGGIGFQGFLGWFMVKSGLSAPESTPPAVAQYHSNSTVASGRLDARMEGMPSTQGTSSTSNDWHPRVSQFRLAAHLGMAFLVGLGMLHTGISILRDYKAGTGTGMVSGLSMSSKSNAPKLYQILASSRVSRFRNVARGMTALVFLTAMSGALVAGLDAGLVYSEFPYMGNGLAPPRDELLDPKYALQSNYDSLPRTIIGNASQNPVTVQFMHRCLAMTTLLSVLGLGLYSRRLSASLRQSGIILPKIIPRLAVLASLTATMQATLGISTLIYLVPIELASAHQAGSVALLGVMTALLACLRKSPIMLRQSLAHAPMDSNRQVVISKVLKRVRTV